mmetsp:Transcript_40118/g.90119  ORF Transcript_40118/g.90119 Transcript_40118/m.90119 type:complete len:551 (+) Transcript_40118:3-1655(+)
MIHHAAFASTCAATLSVASVVFLCYFQRDCSLLSFFASLAGFLCALSIVSLVPLDIYASVPELNDGDRDARTALQELWNFLYWVTFWLTWAVCPLLMYYEDAGGFTWGARLKTSLIINGRWFLLYLVIGIVGTVLIWSSEEGSWWDFSVVFKLAIAASNAWGLFLVSTLMGYGLVGVPRTVWQAASYREALEMNYARAPAFHEEKVSAMYEVDDIVRDVQVAVAASSGTSRAEFANQMWHELEQDPISAEACRSFTSMSPSRRQVPVASLEDLALLNWNRIQVMRNARRTSCQWDMLCRSCWKMSDMLGPRQSQRSRAFSLARFYGYRSMSVLIVLLSVLTFVGEMTMFSKANTSVFYYYFEWVFGLPWNADIAQGLVSVPLVFIVCTTYWSVLRIRIAGFFGLYRRNTDTSILLWCASILCRLAAPLCYHFLLLGRFQSIGDGVDTEFVKFMGKIDVIPVLGVLFNEYFPLLVGIQVVVNALNIYPALVRCVGVSSLEFDFLNSATADPRQGESLVTEARRGLPAHLELATPSSLRSTRVDSPRQPLTG